MTTDIKEKIKSALSKSSYSEEDVVYLLAEAYKFLERENKLETFNVIRFYRNWACHSSLSKDSEKIFEEVYILIRAGKYIPSIPGKPDWLDLMGDEIKRSFRVYSPLQLKLEIEKLATLLQNQKVFNWESFRPMLYEVIKDVPLSIKEKGSEIFRFECKEPFTAARFDDLELKAIVGKNIIFSFTLNDSSL